MAVIDLQCIDDIIDDVLRTVTKWLNEEASEILSDEIKANIKKNVDTIIEDAYYSCIIEQEEEEEDEEEFDEDEEEEEPVEEKDWFERIWYCGEEGVIEFETSDFDSGRLINDILGCMESNNSSAISQGMKERLVQNIRNAIGEGFEQIDRAEELSSYA
jgi:hypothetical protein